ncbi:hypothetical protein BDZ91DRAFT_708496 [Kalaharituber pfeilii]|nr:hypothetical protein BDZ91DRAFT_708496 [Kalaharituber pfeilii]
MAPATTITPLSPAELAYLATSLSLTPPIRPDCRLPTQFRPLAAETDILPTCNGSARMVWADGAECVAGVKAEVERTEDVHGVPTEVPDEGTQGVQAGAGPVVNRRSWVEVSVDVQGLRDDDPLNVFLAGVVMEGLFAGAAVEEPDAGLTGKLKINDRYHWKLYIDILLITPPPTSSALSTTHPLTLLSFTTHLALRTTKLPLPASQGNEDPIFHDDWDLAIPLYAPTPTTSATLAPPSLPPISLLVMTIGPNVLLDPSRDELSVAEAVWSITLLPSYSTNKSRIAGIRTLETIPVVIEDKTVGAKPGIAPGAPIYEGGVVGGRGGVAPETVKKAVKVVGRCASEVWDALEGILRMEREGVGAATR